MRKQKVILQMSRILFMVRGKCKVHKKEIGT